MAIIAHIDLDSFFASCERVRSPDLDDHGIVICMYSGRSKDSGAVSTADYTARDAGIHAGMPITRAKDLAADAEEDIAFLAADKEYYGTVSERVMRIVREHADDIEVASIDEAYVELSSCGSYREAETVMETVRQEIMGQEQVTASAGIGPNKLVAKMASDRDKPDGMTVIRPDDVEQFLEGMPVSDLYGVGPKTAEQLHDMDVTTVGGLREIPVQRLIATFGENRGLSLHEKSRGKGSETLEDTEQKQLSRIRTLSQNTQSMSDIRPVIRELARDVMERVDERGLRYARVSAIFVTTELDRHTRSRTLKAPTDAEEPLFRAAEDLVSDFLEETSSDIRRIGVRAAEFDDTEQQTLDGF